MLTDGHMRFKKDIKDVRGLSTEYDLDSAGLSRMGCGGRIFCLVVAEALRPLEYVINKCRENNIGFHIIGDCTNTLISDRFHDEVFIKLGDGFAQIEKIKEQTIKVGAACNLQKLVVKSYKMGMDLSYMAGIPGTVGGAVFCNSGPKDKSISLATERIQALVLRQEGIERVDYPKDRIVFKYRSLSSPKGIIITDIFLRLIPGEGDLLKAIREKIKIKKLNQPVKTRNLGCFFKNPEGRSAGKLIDECGLKGFKYGGAMVSRLHANFIENHNNATFEDIIKLSRIVKHQVKNKFEITLEPEVKIIE